MMTSLQISNVDRHTTGPLPALRLSAYERTASWLLALLLVSGAVASCLFVIWLGMHANFAFFKAVPVSIMQPSGGGQGELGEQLVLDAPSAAEFAAESDLTDPQFQSTLETLFDAAALREAALADADSLDDGLSGGRGQDTENLRVGTGWAGGTPGIPPHLRWEIDWGGADTLESYARKLDFFDIELGVFGVPGPGQLTYVRNFSHVRPDVRTGAAKQDKRLYMSWRSGALKDADRRLAIKAGVPAGRILLQFFSVDTEQLLLRIEQEFRGRKASTIRKTRFGLRSAGNAYEFYVIEQRAA